jgi:hypothetical protein
MGQAMNRLLALFGFFTLSVSSIGQADDTRTLSACYGERIEVVFAAFTSEDGIKLPAVHLSLPSPNAWLIRVPDNSIQLLGQLPCRDEPVVISRAIIMGIDPRLGHVEIPVVGAPSVRVESIRIGRSRPDALASEAARDTERITSEGTAADSGFLRLIGTNTDAVGGAWLFPEDYLSPFGDRISIGCGGGSCGVSYGLDPETNLSLLYRLVIEDTSRQPDWIAIDQSIRELVQEWIKDS